MSTLRSQSAGVSGARPGTLCCIDSVRKDALTVQFSTSFQGEAMNQSSRWFETKQRKYLLSQGGSPD